MRWKIPTSKVSASVLERDYCVACIVLLLFGIIYDVVSTDHSSNSVYVF